MPRLAQRLVAEAIGTALLLATVVGSGIIAENLLGGNVASMLCSIDAGRGQSGRIRPAVV
jgi:hypothetical protein